VASGGGCAAVESSSLIEIAAWIASIIGGIAACITLGVILYDRRARLNILYRIGRPIDQAQHRLFSANERLGEAPLALYVRMSNASRTDMLVSDVYLEWGNGRTMPFHETPSLTLPSISPPGGSWDFYVPMESLAQALQRQGHVLTASVSLVVQDGAGNLHRKHMLISDIPIWVRGGDPTNAR
jgi:hypothetical protein